jgi:hypothetical protein
MHRYVLNDDDGCVVAATIIVAIITYHSFHHAVFRL